MKNEGNGGGQGVEEAEIMFEVTGGVGIVTLNRPKALNALNLAMIRAFYPKLGEWANDPNVHAVVIKGAGEKAFCAGGDVRAVWKVGMGLDDTAPSMTRDFFYEEYRLNHRIHTFPKPYIALLDGITMGGGVGLSVHGSHRIATERTMFAMPETGIGLFPDVGGSWFLNRCPGESGTYAALTGGRFHAGDILAIGIASEYVPSSKVDALEERLCSADWSAGRASDIVDGIVAEFAEHVGAPDHSDHFAIIDRCFAYDTVEEILEALDAEGSDFAAETAKTIRSKSPTSLKLTLAQLRRGRDMDFDDVMRMEFRLSQGCMRKGSDFYEGIRAVLVDKDHAPKWSPARLEDVDAAMIERFFEKPEGGDLEI